jgi:predicted dehydrogenase
MKIALLEASHWHVPLYLDALQAPGIEVVAVSDAEHVKGEQVAERFGSALYRSSHELLDREEVDSRLPSAGTPKCRRSPKR